MIKEKSEPIFEVDRRAVKPMIDGTRLGSPSNSQLSTNMLQLKITYTTVGLNAGGIMGAGDWHRRLVRHGRLV